jgi:hypothetical protein
MECISYAHRECDGDGSKRSDQESDGIWTADSGLPVDPSTLGPLASHSTSASEQLARFL